MATADLVVPLDRACDVPLGQQLARQVRVGIEDGRLRAGDRLPASRRLAAALGVARTVVQQGYDQLVAEGWVVGRQGSGMYVADVRPVATPGYAPRRNTAAVFPPSAISLRPGVPWGERSASPAWRRAWRTVSARPMPSGYPDPQGLEALREQICAYLGRARGVACTPDEVLVTSGTTHGLGLLLDCVAGPGTQVAVEDPGYRSAVQAVRCRRLAVVDLPVDDEGADVSALGRLRTPRLVYVTPSHQHPMGVPLSARRRQALVAWARQSSGLVVEDDYDSEFRFDVAPLPALAQLDRDHVIYLGTSSKTFGPALRLGWLVAAPDLIRSMVAYRRSVADYPSWPVHVAYASLLAEGYVDMVVRRMRRVYADRSARVFDALSPFGAVSGRHAGLHLTLVLPDGVDHKVQTQARQQGVDVPTLSEYQRSLPGRSGLVIGYGGVSDSQLDAALEIVVAALLA